MINALFSYIAVLLTLHISSGSDLDENVRESVGFGRYALLSAATGGKLLGASRDAPIGFPPYAPLAEGNDGHKQFAIASSRRRSPLARAFGEARRHRLAR